MSETPDESKLDVFAFLMTKEQAQRITIEINKLLNKVSNCDSIPHDCLIDFYPESVNLLNTVSKAIKNMTPEKSKKL